MTKMSFGGESAYDAKNFDSITANLSQQQGGKAPVFGGSTGGIISSAMSGGQQQEYNPVTPLPQIRQDSASYAPSPIQIAYGSQATNQNGYVANPLALFGNYNGGAAQPSAPTQQVGGSGGAVFGGSTTGSGGAAANTAGNPYSVGGGGVQSWQVSAPQTVEARAAGIIDKDSPLMQQARGYANQRANERGLINSSLGIQAAQDAVLGRATDIAKQDAATFADAGKFNVNHSNSWNFAQQELGQKGSQFDKDLQYRYDSARMNNENAVAMQALENKYQSQLQSDAAFNAQYRDYVNALLVIDSNKDLDAAAKQALKFEQAQILENYARVRGLNLDLNFSAQYKGGGGAAGTAGQPGAQAGSGNQSGVGNVGQSSDNGGGSGVGGNGGAPSGSSNGSPGGLGLTGDFGNALGFNGQQASVGAAKGGLLGGIPGALFGAVSGVSLNGNVARGNVASAEAAAANAAAQASSEANAEAAAEAASDAGFNGADPGASASNFGEDPGGFGSFGDFGGADPSGADPGGW